MNKLWYGFVTVLCGLLNLTIIVVGIGRMILTAQYIKSQFAQVKLSIKPWLVQFTNQVLLIKVGLLNVLHKVGQLGQQLVTIVRQIPQRVS